jgi:carotenoid cleavage dioxygenase-like enzyme
MQLVCLTLLAGIKGLGADVVGLDVCLYTMGTDRIRTIAACAHTPTFPYSIHSFSMTRSYAIVPVAPVDLEFGRVGLNLCVYCSVRDRLQDGHTSTFYVFDLPNGEQQNRSRRLTGDFAEPVAVIETEGFFTYHQVLWNSVESCFQR